MQNICNIVFLFLHTALKQLQDFNFTKLVFPLTWYFWIQFYLRAVEHMCLSWVKEAFELKLKCQQCKQL